MPGPGSRTKAKAKAAKPKTTGAAAQPTTASSIQDAYIGDIDNAVGWSLIVNILCDAFELPDLTTRSGLKKVHADFDAIYRRIDKVYQKNLGNDKIRGGIVGIYAKMCVDAILRNKLFERGLLDKLMPLLNIPLCRHMALRALGTVTHHGGSDIRVQIAKRSAVLVKIIEENPEDHIVGELTITVLSHSVGAAFDGGEKPTYGAIIKGIDLASVLRVVIETIKKPTASSYAIDHALWLLATVSLHGSEAFRKYPPATRLLVAGLRSKGWVERCSCLRSLILLHNKDAEDDRRPMDPNKFMAAVQHGFPDHLVDILTDYGPPSASESYKTLLTTRDYTNAMMAVVQDGDLYRLGLKLVEYILRTEFSISHGAFETVNERTGKREILKDTGLPFTMWSDALPHCAKAIRAKKNASEVDYADILDIKYQIMKSQVPAAVQIAKKGLERNPECAYFYYAISLSADRVQGLRACKKGLRCRNITPFLKFQLMQRAVEHAGDMGISALQDSHGKDEHKWEEGIAFLTSALEDSRAFVKEAPPDNRHMKNVLYWLILLTVVFKEAGLSSNLSELKDLTDKLKVADEFSRLMGIPPPQTYLRLTQATVIKSYAEAVREFSDVIQRVGVSDPAEANPSSKKTEDDLASWLEDTHVDDEHIAKPEHSHPKISTNHVALYRCSWCGNPSAALRKCSGCNKTRYCDSACQKAHWIEHKKACKA